MITSLIGNLLYPPGFLLPSVLSNSALKLTVGKCFCIFFFISRSAPINSSPLFPPHKPPPPALPVLLRANSLYNAAPRSPMITPLFSAGPPPSFFLWFPLFLRFVPFINVKLHSTEIPNAFFVFAFSEVEGKKSSSFFSPFSFCMHHGGRPLPVTHTLSFPASVPPQAS